MAIGERIRYFRSRRKLTQKELGLMMGYTRDSADVRIAQYENESRRPKGETVEELAEILEVSPKALTIPDIDNTVGFMHTLFALEDRFGLHAISDQSTAFLFVDDGASDESAKLQWALHEWGQQFRRYLTGRISEEEYDQWRYNYPESIKLRRAKPVKVKRINLKNK